VASVGYVKGKKKMVAPIGIERTSILLKKGNTSLVELFIEIFDQNVRNICVGDRNPHHFMTP
jgi:hypothetical protein